MQFKSNIELIDFEINILEHKISEANSRINNLTKERNKILGATKKPEIIYLKSPASEENCEENDGIPECIFRINKKEWLDIGKILNEDPRYYENIEKDYSSGGHGCILRFNLLKMYKDTKKINFIPDDLYNEICDNHFLDMLYQKI